MVVGVCIEGLGLLLMAIDEIAITSYELLTGVAASIRERVLSKFTTHKRLTRDELAVALAEDERIPIEDTERIAVELHHNHLPKLDQNAYIDYDSRTGDAVRWKDPESIRTTLESDNQW